MKLTTRMLGVALSAAVLGSALAGCGSTAATFTELPLPSEVPEDIIMQTAGIARDTPLLTVDGAEVPAEELLYWLSSYADQYAAWGMTDLTMDMGDGQTLGQYYLDSAVETATLYQLMENKAEELKMGWTKENQDSYDEQLQTMKESLASRPVWTPRPRATEWTPSWSASSPTWASLRRASSTSTRPASSITT